MRPAAERYIRGQWINSGRGNCLDGTQGRGAVKSLKGFGGQGGEVKNVMAMRKEG